MIDVSMLNTMQVTDQRLQKEECDLDEKELLRQLQKQRAGALEQAVAQYGAYVLAIIRNRSRGVLTPEDHEEIASKEYMAVLADHRSGRAGLRHRVRRDVPCFTIKTTQNDIIGIHASQISISNLLPGMLN